MDFITSKFIPNYTDYQDKDVKRDYIKLSAFLRIFFLFIAFIYCPGHIMCNNCPP